MRGAWSRAGVGLVLSVAALNPVPVGAQYLPPDVELELMLRFLVEDRETTGIVVGVREADGSTRVQHFGDPGPDASPLGPQSAFEIGSITKTFTAAVLADMALRGELALEDPVSRYLPEHVVVPSHEGREITLLDLATHRSGLPRIPDNLRITAARGPYADYSIDSLYSFLSRHELRRAPGEAYEYSNTGYGLLGHALARAAGASFRDLVRNRVLEPLGMDATDFVVEEAASEGEVRGHRFGVPVPPTYVTEAMQGAGGLRSTAPDMLKYIDASIGAPQNSLQRAIRFAQAILFPDSETGGGQGLAWRTIASPGAAPIVELAQRAGLVLPAALLSIPLFLVMIGIRSAPRRGSTVTLAYSAMAVAYWLAWTLTLYGLHRLGFFVTPTTLGEAFAFSALYCLTVYTAQVLIFEAILHLRDSQRHEIDVARLRLELSQADAAAYRARLDPEYLFGTFRQIADLMDRDVAQARRALAELSDRLRNSLGRNGDR